MTTAKPASPYRAAVDELGELRHEYRGQFSATIVYGMVSVAIVVLIVLAWSVSILRELGSITAIVDDARKGGASKVLIVPFIAAFAALLAWISVRTIGSIRTDRVRFYERGVEILTRRGVLRARYDALTGAEIIDDRATGGRGRVHASRVTREDGEPWTIPSWFHLLGIQVRLRNEIAAARREAGKT